MNSVWIALKEMARKSVERDRSLEGRVESLSRLLWPWRESRLLELCGLLALLDFTSTYAALVLSGDMHIVEGGRLALWALTEGGFPRLFWIDAAAMGGLVLLAVASRFLYSNSASKVSAAAPLY